MDLYLKLKECEMLTKKKQYVSATENLKEIIECLWQEKQDKKRDQILSEAYNDLGYIHYKKVEFKQALQCYDQSIKLNSCFGVPYYNRGTVLYRLGFYAAALKDLEQSVLCDSGNSEFQLALEECKYASKFH